MTTAILIGNVTQANRQHNIAKVTVKNSTNQTITIPTHQGAITIPYGGSKSLEILRGQSYDVIIYDKKGGIVDSASTKFTPGNYTVQTVTDPESDDPNAVKLTVTKPDPNAKKSYYR